MLIADLRRRRLLGARFLKTPFLTILDLAGPALASAFSVIALLIHCATSANSGNQGPATSAFVEFIAGVAITYYLWGEGKRSIQFQRPNGIVFGQFCILGGIVVYIAGLLRPNLTAARWFSVEQVTALAGIAIGGVLLLWIVPRFLKDREEHRIVSYVAERGTETQAEYHPATPECPHPERWRMFDSMSAEIEVLDFLECMITTLKPQLVLETGTFIGLSTLRMAAGMKKNGFGKTISCEFDPVVYASAKKKIDASGLAEWIELRNESSLETTVEGQIDIFFSDSDIVIREQEVRRFLSQVSPYGVILMHDASSHNKHVREGALRLEKEGLISVVLLSTPRGLVLAQRKEGRE